MQVLDAKLQEVLGRDSTADEAMEVDDLVVGVSDLKLQIADAEGEKNELEDKMEEAQKTLFYVRKIHLCLPCYAYREPLVWIYVCKVQ